MPKASSEIVINRAREEVFAFLADPENHPQWRRGVLDLKRGSGDGVGAQYAQGVKGQAEDHEQRGRPTQLAQARDRGG